MTTRSTPGNTEHTGTKKCGVCKELLPPAAFNRNAGRRDGRDSRCRACRKIETAKRATRARAIAIAWKANNPEAVKKISRSYYQRHALRERTRSREYARQHCGPERNARHRSWQLANADRCRQIMNLSNQKRRARTKGAAGTITADQWRAIKETFGDACAYCFRTERPLAQDHVVALSRGGDHTEANVVPSCKSCNSKKGTRPVWTMLAGGA
jgi:5-methylcytosine-specific restriction endonuclease McrA